MAYRGGQGGGHGPRAQALEGVPAQLVGANFKKKIRPRQISKVTSLQCRINLVVKVAYMLWAPRFQEPRAPYALGGLSCLFLAEDPLFLLVDFFPRAPPPVCYSTSLIRHCFSGGCRIYQRGGGAHPEPQRRQPCRPMWQGGANSGGGGRRCKHWARGAGDPRYATVPS